MWNNFQGPVKTVEKKTDFQIIKWQNLKLKFEIWNLQFEIKKHDQNITIQKSFPSKLQEYSSYLELILLVNLPSLFEWI